MNDRMITVIVLTFIITNIIIIVLNFALNVLMHYCYYLYIIYIYCVMYFHSFRNEKIN